MANGPILNVAFLGPDGTYTHQAASEIFGRHAHYISQPSIENAINSVSEEIPFSVVPIENSTFGAVIETLDLLCSSRAGQNLFVLGENVLSISHSLIAKQGTLLEDISLVISHEQALGQCSEFLKTHLPNAAIRRSASTAAAVSEALEDPGGRAGAIASAICLQIFPGSHIVRENIQNTQSNKTRFLVLSYSQSSRLPPTYPKSGKNRALFRFTLPPPSAPTSSSVLQIILAAIAPLRITSIDRRPTQDAEPFRDIYFIWIEDIEEGQKWGERALEHLERIRKSIGTIEESSRPRAELLGSWM